MRSIATSASAAPAAEGAPETPRRARAAEIRAQGISKSYGSFRALDDVSLTIGRGEFLTLLGPSGSGKTTLLMILGGFEQMTQGQLFLDGTDMSLVSAEDRGFGMVFQGYALFPHMTVAQNIAFPLKVQRRSAREITRRTDEMIEMVGLGGHGHKRPAALSGGQQQRVALARALAYEPPVMLLDEPFSALDRNLRGQMQDEMRRLHRDTGTTFVFVTHDQDEALALSSRVAIFNHGKLQQLDAPRAVYERPTSRFVAEFLGDVNILPVTDAYHRDGVTHARFEDQTLTAASGAGTPTGSLAIRPEAMALANARPSQGNAIEARVIDAMYLGSETRLTLVTPGGIELRLSLTEVDATAAALGDKVWISWPMERGIFL